MPAKKKAKNKSDDDQITKHEKAMDMSVYFGYDAFRIAKVTQEKLREMGVIGALMRGVSRNQVRKTYHISPTKLNKILDGETLEDFASLALNQLFALQSDAINAIKTKLIQGDGVLAMNLLEKLGTFKGSRIDRVLGVKEDAQGAEKERSFGEIFYAKIQTGRVPTEIEELTKDLIRDSDT